MSGMGAEEVTSDDRLWALLGYILPLIALIALLMEDKKNRPFIKYHAIHALVFAVLTIILSFTVCLWVIPWIWAIIVGFQAYQGRWAEVPGITNFVKGQGWV